MLGFLRPLWQLLGEGAKFKSTSRCPQHPEEKLHAYGQGDSEFKGEETCEASDTSVPSLWDPGRKAEADGCHSGDVRSDRRPGGVLQETGGGSGGAAGLKAGETALSPARIGPGDSAPTVPSPGAASSTGCRPAGGREGARQMLGYSQLVCRLFPLGRHHPRLHPQRLREMQAGLGPESTRKW